jgi:hypothetical protein
MRGGLIGGTDKKIDVKIGDKFFEKEAFTLSYRKGLIRRNIVDLELKIDLTKFKDHISLLFNELLRKLTNNRSYILPNEYESEIFDSPSRDFCIRTNNRIITSATNTPKDHNFEIYSNYDGNVSGLFRDREFGKLSDREISLDKIYKELNNFKSIDHVRR